MLRLILLLCCVVLSLLESFFCRMAYLTENTDAYHSDHEYMGGESSSLLQGSQASPVRPSGRKSMTIKK
jgi:hypothetical protein